MPCIIYHDGQSSRAVELPPGGGVSIGRGKGNDISLPQNRELSRRHCGVFASNGGFVVRDFSSTNGTTLNGEPVVAESRPLEKGDVFAAGDINFIFRLDDQAPGAKKVAKAVSNLSELQPSTPLADGVPDPAQLKKIVAEKTILHREEAIDLQAGDLVRGYEITRKIGEGRLARVYLVRDPSGQKVRVMKVYNRDFSAHPPGVAAFNQAIDDLAVINATNMVKYYDRGEFNGHCFMVMDYWSNGNLNSRIAKSAPFSTISAAGIVIKIIEALLDINTNHHLIHRDLKPKNILFTRGGGVVLTDLGLAGWAVEHLADQVSVASPAYISPEQINGDNIDWSCDQYALGIIMFELLTGKQPFRHRDEGMVLGMHLNAEIESADIPVIALSIIKRMTAKKVDERYQSWDEVLTELIWLRKSDFTQKTPAQAEIRPPSMTERKHRAVAKVRKMRFGVSKRKI